MYWKSFQTGMLNILSLFISCIGKSVIFENQKEYDFYKGTRRKKLLDSNEIWQLRDVCIFEVNGVEVYM